MATFAGFAVIGVAFFQFGVGIAIDRASPWETYLRTLPVGPAVRLARAARSRLRSSPARPRRSWSSRPSPRPGVSLPAARWAGLGAALLAGIVPFAFLGIALGYWAPAKGALPIANLLYLVLAYVGGLWILPVPASGAPSSAISRFLPTRALSDGLAATARGAPVDWGAWLRSPASRALFAGVAVAGYRRDEGRRFS